MVALDRHLLLNGQPQVFNGNLALAVIDDSLGLDLLGGKIHVLFEPSLDTGGALINTAPSCDLVLTLLINASLELRRNFSDNQNLFVLNVFDLVLLGIANDSNVILDFALGLGFDVFFMEKD